MNESYALGTRVKTDAGVVIDLGVSSILAANISTKTVMGTRANEEKMSESVRWDRYASW